MTSAPALWRRVVARPVVSVGVAAILMLGTGCATTEHENGNPAPQAQERPRVQITTDPEVSTAVGNALAAAADEAIDRVVEVWGPGSLPTEVPIIMAGTAERFGELSGISGTRVDDDVPAVLAEGVVIVHPQMGDRLDADGQALVMTHELTHLALERGGTLPWWLSEGAAEYTAYYRGSDEPVPTVQTPAGEQRDAPPWPPPHPEAADLVGEGRLEQYAGARMAVEFLVDRFGQEVIVAMITDVAGGAELDDTAAEHLELPLQGLAAEWELWWSDRVSERGRSR